MLWDKDIEQIIHDIRYRAKSVEQHPRGPLAADAARRTERTIKGWVLRMPPPPYWYSSGRDLHQGRGRARRG